ncbi:MAG: hypothetical protein ABI155_11700 [Paralcaligenes sp.]
MRDEASRSALTEDVVDMVLDATSFATTSLTIKRLFGWHPEASPAARYCETLHTRSFTGESAHAQKAAAVDNTIVPPGPMRPHDVVPAQSRREKYDTLNANDIRGRQARSFYANELIRLAASRSDAVQRELATLAPRF